MKTAHLQRIEATPADLEGQSLPAWIYRDAEFLEHEQRTIFRTAWQIVCHLSDIPRVGDYQAFQFLGESIFVVRAEEGVRAFHNV
jgi:carnitine monooxygenase subunit